MIEGLHVSGIVNLRCKADAEDATEKSDSDGKKGFIGGEVGEKGLRGDDGGSKSWELSNGSASVEAEHEEEVKPNWDK